MTRHALPKRKNRLRIGTCGWLKEPSRAGGAPGKLWSMNALASDLTSALPTVLLWAGASLVAIILLGRSMQRRRQALTDSLKKHVSQTIGPPVEAPPDSTIES